MSNSNSSVQYRSETEDRARHSTANFTNFSVAQRKEKSSRRNKKEWEQMRRNYYTKSRSIQLYHGMAWHGNVERLDAQSGMAQAKPRNVCETRMRMRIQMPSLRLRLDSAFHVSHCAAAKRSAAKKPRFCA